MMRIIEHKVDLDLPAGKAVNSLVAQIPTRLHLEGRLFKIKDRIEQATNTLAVLRLAGNLPHDEAPQFIFLPESSVPFEALETVLETVEKKIPHNTVVIFGMEHITLLQFRNLLERYGSDNSDLLELLAKEDFDEDRSKPVNLCVTVVSERTGKLRCFLAAKTHPFAGEEAVDNVFDLYRGKALLLFSCLDSPFNFMPLICFDYVYRDLHHSNIMEIIGKANEIYFRQRQNLNLLAVIQCNPKPDHKVFRDVVTGFYGEHLFKTPGTRDTLTVFINSSSETELEGSTQEDTFGHSSIVTGISHKLPKIKLSEFKTDDFSGAPVSRLRFGAATRLYLCRIFPHHETDPRSSRAMVKVTGVYRPAANQHWERISGEDLLTGITEDLGEPDGYI